MSVKITLMLIAGLAICETHTIVGFFYPRVNAIEYTDLWIGNYHEPITLAFYMYEVENYLAWIVWAIAFSIVAREVSQQLSNIILIFMVYFFTQLMLYLYDRNTIFFSVSGYKIFISNFTVWVYMLAAVITLLIPNKGGKIINLK